ncbi:MAG: nitrilase-related carbon-nitrogen hydrolase [Pseudomonadota bacterium]
MIKIACCQYQIDKFSDWNGYANKIDALVKQASAAGAQLLLLPEYAGMEIGGCHPTDNELFAAMQVYLQAYCDLFKRLANRYQIYIQAGTVIEAISPTQYVNRAYLFSPAGKMAYQDKLQLIEFEKESKILTSGNSQTLFDTALGKIGIAICYDSEFPEIVRRLVDAGAWLILVPSYTISTAAHQRVFLSCRARALENQCYVAASFIVGEVALSEPVEHAVGQAGVFGPVEHGYSDDGIVVEGRVNDVGIITAELAQDELSKIRSQGKVHLFNDAKRCKDLLKQQVQVTEL